VAVHLRAPALKDGESTPGTYLSVSENSPPYTCVAQGCASVTLGPVLVYDFGQDVDPAKLPH